MEKLFYTIILLFLLSCQTKKPQQSTYVISRANAEIATDRPPPVPVRYSSCNIIFAENSKVYVHHLYVRRRCLTCFEQSKPDFLGLMPNDIIVLEGNQVISYLENNVYDAICKGIGVSIASPKDTIVHSEFFELANYLKLKGTMIIRRITEEENYVLKAKREFLTYNPEKIEWTNGFCNIEKLQPIWELRNKSFNSHYRP